MTAISYVPNSHNAGSYEFADYRNIRESGYTSTVSNDTGNISIIAAFWFPHAQITVSSPGLVYAYVVPPLSSLHNIECEAISGEESSFYERENDHDTPRYGNGLKQDLWAAILFIINCLVIVAIASKGIYSSKHYENLIIDPNSSSEDSTSLKPASILIAAITMTLAASLIGSIFLSFLLSHAEMLIEAVMWGNILFVAVLGVGTLLSTGQIIGRYDNKSSLWRSTIRLTTTINIRIYHPFCNICPELLLPAVGASANPLRIGSIGHRVQSHPSQLQRTRINLRGNAPWTDVLGVAVASSVSLFNQKPARDWSRQFHQTSSYFFISLFFFRRNTEF